MLAVGRVDEELDAAERLRRRVRQVIVGQALIL